MANNAINSQLSDIARLAYGSRLIERTSGGRGNIGMIDGKVVKFNTHIGERGGATTDAMRKSFDQLRTSLYSLAQYALKDTHLTAGDQKAVLDDIRKKLGLGEEGKPVFGKGLLDRKVVASVINKIASKTGVDYYGARADLQPLASTNRDTQFTAVTERVESDLFESNLTLRFEKDFANVKPGVDRQALRSVIQKSVGLVYENSGMVTARDLTKPGSTYDLLKRLATGDKPFAAALNRALTLDPKEARELFEEMLDPDKYVSRRWRQIDSMVEEIAKGTDPKSDASTESTQLLKSVVTRAVRQIIDETGDIPNETNLKGNVLNIVKSVSQEEVRGSLEEVRGSLDTLFAGTPDVKLNREQRDFLMDCIQRDLDRRLAEDRPFPSAAEIKASLAELRHPALVATFQRFGLDSVRFAAAHAKSPIASQRDGAPFIAGAPAEQVADRVDLMLQLLGGGEGSHPSSATMALVSEKLPQMRQLQPEGPLSLNTVWRACFGKDVPSELVKMSGTKTVTQAFERETEELIKSLRGPLKADMSEFQLLLTISMSLNQGMGLSAAVKLATYGPGFTVVPTRDFVATPSVYNREDAEIKTEKEISERLASDFARQNVVVTISNPDGSEKILDMRNLGLRANGGRKEVEDFIREIDAFVGDVKANHTQRNVLMFAFSQAGLSPLASVKGVGGEHSDVSIRLEKSPDGTISVRYATPKTDPYDVSFGYSIGPDGSNRLAGEYSVRLRDPNHVKQMEESVGEARKELTAMAGKAFDSFVKRLPAKLTNGTDAVRNLVKKVVAKQKKVFCGSGSWGLASRTVVSDADAGKGAEVRRRIETIMNARLEDDFAHFEETVVNAMIDGLVGVARAKDPSRSMSSYARQIRAEHPNFEDLCAYYEVTMSKAQ